MTFCDYVSANINKIQKGKEVELNISVTNRGFLYSDNYNVLVKEGNDIIHTLPSPSLPPGKTAILNPIINLQKNFYNLSILIDSKLPELDKTNNSKNFLLKARPDYEIRSVALKNNDSIVVKIKDIKGVATTAVDVNFYLFENNSKTKIHSTLFDPNKELPIEFNFPALASKSNDYLINVVVNEDRKIIEDNFSNNQKSFHFRNEDDFVVKKLRVFWQGIKLTIENIGNKNTDKVNLLITPSVQLAASPKPIIDITPVFFQEVTLVDNKKELLLPLSLLSNLSEDEKNNFYLYAVVNPYNGVNEIKRDNNVSKVSQQLYGTSSAPVLYAHKSINIGFESYVIGDIASKDKFNGLGNFLPKIKIGKKAKIKGDKKDKFKGPKNFLPEIKIGKKAKIKGDIYGDTVLLRKKSEIIGEIYTNDLRKNPDVVLDSSKIFPLDLPVNANLIEFPSFEPGTLDIEVKSKNTITLEPGDYRKVRLKPGRGMNNTVLKLSGGIYNIKDLQLGMNSRLECETSCEIRIKKRLNSLFRSYIGPSKESNLNAADVRIFIEGVNGFYGKKFSFPESAYLGYQNMIIATIYAPNGTIYIDNFTTINGQMVGKWIDVGMHSKIILGNKTIAKDLSDLSPSMMDYLKSIFEKVIGMFKHLLRLNFK